MSQKILATAQLSFSFLVPPKKVVLCGHVGSRGQDIYHVPANNVMPRVKSNVILLQVAA